MARFAVVNPRPWMPLVATLLVGSCGGGGSPSSQSCGGVIGLSVPPCTCISWTNHVIPTGETSAASNPVLVPDWSTSPPRTVLTVGATFSLSAVVIQETPYQCNQGATSNEFTWTISNPSVLALESRGAGASRHALFRAAGPGTSRVAVEGLLLPGGGTSRVELTTCNRGATGSLQDGYICADRVPLTITVVP